MSEPYNPLSRKNTFPWSAQAHADLKELYVNQGLSASLTADALAEKYKHPISRSSVIGKLHLLKITRGAPTVLKEHSRKKKARPAISVGLSSIASPLRRGTPRAGYLPPEPVVEGVRKVTLMTLKAGECKWPVTPHAPFFFCGLPAAGHNYCEAHRTVSKPADSAKAEAEIDKAAKYG